MRISCTAFYIAVIKYKFGRGQAV